MTPFKNLTPRETEVLHLIAEGLLNREIAEQLQLSESTVESYLDRIYRKLKVRNRTEAAACYLQD